ncbi:TPA: hypothetical protein ACNE4N_004565 [Escherichia coli]
MKIFSIEHYEDKIEKLERQLSVVAHRAEQAHKIAKKQEETLEGFYRLYYVMKVAEQEQDSELEEYMAAVILEYAAKHNIIEAGEVVTDEEIIERLSKRIGNAYFEATYYLRKETSLYQRLTAAAKVIAQLQKVKIFKLNAALAVGKMLFPGRFN